MAPLSLPDLRPSAWLRLPSWRVLVIVGVVVVLLGGVSLGAWVWISAQQRRGLEAFADAMIKVHLSQAPNPPPDAKAAAIRELEATLSQRPPALVVSQVTYELGNLKYQEKSLDASRVAYETAAASKSPTVSRLAQVSLGYIWEAQKDYGKAIQVFDKAVASLGSNDFLYDELLVDLARVQELAGRKDDAIKTYRRILANPTSRRADDIRVRLAALGVKP